MPLLPAPVLLSPPRSQVMMCRPESSWRHPHTNGVRMMIWVFGNAPVARDRILTTAVAQPLSPLPNFFGESVHKIDLLLRLRRFVIPISSGGKSTGNPLQCFTCSHVVFLHKEAPSYSACTSSPTPAVNIHKLCPLQTLIYALNEPLQQCSPWDCKVHYGPVKAVDGGVRFCSCHSFLPWWQVLIECGVPDALEKLCWRGSFQRCCNQLSGRLVGDKSINASKPHSFLWRKLILKGDECPYSCFQNLP